MSDVEKKRQILTYITLVKKQFSKLLVLVKWAKDANDVQMCQVWWRQYKQGQKKQGSSLFIFFCQHRTSWRF
jgi:hypothetical protein